jgi:glycosyltransferase involved in cell wall biosynthesis
LDALKNKIAIVTVSNDLATDNRVNRTCNVLIESGYNVLLVGRKRKNSISVRRQNYRCKRLNLLFNKGWLFYAELNIRLFIFLLFSKVDLIFSNDLDTLPAAFLAHKLKRRSKIVYDSHELFTEAPELEGRFVKKIWERIEKMIFPKLQHIITVNDSIAAIFKAKYRKSIVVIRNVSEKFDWSELKSKKELGIPEDKELIIVQGSGLNIDRGIEEAILAMQFINNAILLIVGDGDVIPNAKELMKTHQLETKVLFFGKRPYKELMQFTRYASIGLALDKPKSLNYRFALPNKLFDYIQGNTAVICSNLIEIQKIVEKYEIGISIETISPEAIAETINRLLENKEKLLAFQENCKKAAEVENWENEKVKLKALLEQVVAN